MAKKSRVRRRQPVQPRLPWRWLAAAGLLLVLAGGLAFWMSSRERSVESPQVAGAPRLIVDQTLVDEGYVQFNVPVRTTYRLSNVGDQPLRILGEPRVELVEGC
ncbi:MAG: hypothetical protein Kow0063_14280 [Anaerolineae bacterium]